MLDAITVGGQINGLHMTGSIPEMNRRIVGAPFGRGSRHGRKQERKRNRRDGEQTPFHGPSSFLPGTFGPGVSSSIRARFEGTHQRMQNCEDLVKIRARRDHDRILSGAERVGPRGCLTFRSVGRDRGPPADLHLAFDRGCAVHTTGSIARGAALFAIVAVAIPLAVASCSMPGNRSSAPNSHCADLVAQAVTSYFIVKGSGKCIYSSGRTSLADYVLAGFTADPPPVFDRINHACGYHPVDQTFTYLASNVSDGAAGRIIVLVDGAGVVHDVAKHLDRRPGSSTPIACPSATRSYSFN